MNGIIISALLGVLMMFTGILMKKSKWIQGVALVGVVGLLAAVIYDFRHVGQGVLHHFNMMEETSMSDWFNVLLTIGTMLYLFVFHKSISAVGRNDADYFALIFFILCGAFLLTSYSHLLMLFLGIEIMSIPQYILAGSDKENVKSHEASLKYFLMGAFSTGLLLMSITLLYGATGSFDITSEAFAGHFSAGHLNSLAFTGIMLMVIALGFKVSAAPMHFWTPDVYDGAPTAFVPFMSTIVKVAVFAAFIRLFHYSFSEASLHWKLILGIMIALTLLVGNVTAIYQSSVKRMMAYSSIAQAGFMMFAVFATSAYSWKGIYLYSLAYTLASLGVFATLIRLKDYSYDGFNGLGKKHPVLAITTSICLFSLAGIPLTGGFFAKYYMLNAMIEKQEWLWLVFFAIIMAAVSTVYYFRVIRSMYFRDGDPVLTEKLNPMETILLIINALVVIILGIYPQLVF